MALSNWDLQIISEMEAEIEVIEKAIAGKTNQQLVCLPFGDSRPMLVGAHRTTIQQKRREIAEMRKQDVLVCTCSERQLYQVGCDCGAEA